MKLTDVVDNMLKKLAELGRLVSLCPIGLCLRLIVALHDAGAGNNQILTDIYPTPRQSKRLNCMVFCSWPPNLLRRRQLYSLCLLLGKRWVHLFHLLLFRAKGRISDWNSFGSVRTECRTQYFWPVDNIPVIRVNTSSYAPLEHL